MGLKICPLASGSSGNATYISTGKTSLLVDCGTTQRDLLTLLRSIQVNPADLNGILITHAHKDHYMSAGTIHAKFGVPVFVDPATAWAAYRRGGATSWARIKETRPLPDVIGDLEIRAFDTQHGYYGNEGRSVGFVLEHQSPLQHRRRRAVVATDLGTVTPAVEEALRGAGAMVLEANYHEEAIERKLSGECGDFTAHEEYLHWVRSDWGHLSNRQCGEALAVALTGNDCHVFLGHMSVPHSDPRMDNNDHRTAVETVTSILRKRGAPVPHLHRTWRLLAPRKGSDGQTTPLPVADMIEL
jgi:phosphoribosyl 1,2-cyclic phosphodiesterase